MKRQRERFRKEALRREKEASIAKGNVEKLTRDNQELRRENMHLYKKIRCQRTTMISTLTPTPTTTLGLAAVFAPFFVSVALTRLSIATYSLQYSLDLTSFFLCVVLVFRSLSAQTIDPSKTN